MQIIYIPIFISIFSKYSISSILLSEKHFLPKSLNDAPEFYSSFLSIIINLS